MALSTYVLAVDIGTSRTAAATARLEADGSIRTAPMTLGRRSDSVSSVVFVSDDGELLFGDAAERRGITQPERLVREFKRGVGDEVPHSVGGRQLTSAELYAETVASVVDAATEREGRAPDTLAITHPTAWGPHRIGMVEAALARLGMPHVSMITEPEAAARHYEATHPLSPGQALAVYDLGGGTFDTIILRAEADGEFAPATEPGGIDDLGGADFDDDVLRHVLAAAGVDTAALALDDPDVALALAQLRRECVDAKEALSFDSDATIPVLIGADRATVRLTRAEFEHMIGPALDRTVDALDAACEAAALEPQQLEAILLIGGSSRIPLVAQRLSERFDRPIAVDTDPKASVSLGAALTALIRSNDELIGVVPAPVDEPGSALALVGASASAVAVADRTETALVLPEAAKPRRRTSPFLLAGAATVLAGAIITASTLTAGSLADQRTDRVTTMRMTPMFQPASVGTATPAAPEALAPKPEAKPVSAVTAPKPAQRTAPVQRVEQRGGEREAVDPRSTPLRPTPKPAPKPATKPPASPDPIVTPSPTTQPTTEPTTQPTTEPTTPPTTEPTTPPTTEPTTPPTTEPTTPPTTEPTTPPTTEPTTPPTTEPTTPPTTEPEPEPSPTSDPDPSPDPSPTST